MALLAGLRSGAKVVSYAGLRKALLVCGIVTVITITDAVYNIYTSVITDDQAAAFKVDCLKLADHVVVTHTDETKTSILKLECLPNEGQPTEVVEESGLKAFLLSNFNSLIAD